MVQSLQDQSHRRAARAERLRARSRAVRRLHHAEVPSARRQQNVAQCRRQQHPPRALRRARSRCLRQPRRLLKQSRRVTLPLQCARPIVPVAPVALAAKVIVRLRVVKRFLVDLVVIRSRVVRQCASCCSLADVVFVKSWSLRNKKTTTRFWTSLNSHRT